jgi:WD40 repeat protein
VDQLPRLLAQPGQHPRLGDADRHRGHAQGGGDGGRVLALRSLTPNERPRETGFTARVAFSPDGRYLAANNWDGSVNVWDGGPPADE